MHARRTHLLLLVVPVVLACLPAPAAAQQLVQGLTGPACAARGGRITTWTNTAGSGPNVGECYIPPRAGGGSAGGGGFSGGRGGAALGAGFMFLDALSSLMESASPAPAGEQRPRDPYEEYRNSEEYRRYKREQDAEDLRIHRERTAAVDARTDDLSDFIRKGPARRPATAAPQGACSAYPDTAEGIAACHREIAGTLEQQAQACAGACRAAMQRAAAVARCVERQQPASAELAAATLRCGQAQGAPAVGFKTDAQIKAECAASGERSLCEGAAFAARADDPAYQRWKQSERARLDDNVRRSKAEVDRLLAQQGRDDPDLAKCREGNPAPWTIAGCYDLRTRAIARPGSLREQLRRALARWAQDQADAAEPSGGTAAGARPASAPTTTQPGPQAPATEAAAAGPWASGPWRTNDEQACRAAGGLMAKPTTANDLAGIPAMVLDDPPVPVERLAATPYCLPGGDFRLAGSETDAEVGRLLRPLPAQDAPPQGGAPVK